MKTNYSKRILSVVLSILMVISSLPAFALTASAADGSKFLFAYFTGDTVAGQKIRFATSSDGEHFSALNDGASVIKQTTGTGCARDPYMFYSEKDSCYYLLATDGDYSHNNWGDAQSSMTIWKSKDLIKWTDETSIDYKDIPGNENAGNNLWAPQALWDDAQGKYMVYYSSCNPNNNNGKAVYYTYTSDLLDVSKYSTPQLINNFSFTNIDADITKVGDEYVMFIKNEDSNSKKIYAAVSSSPNSFANPVLLTTGNSNGYEGPQLYKTTTGYNLVLDQYGSSGNVWLYKFSSDAFASFITNVKNNPSSINISSYYTKTINQTNDGFAARHGSILSITDAQYEALQTAEFNSAADPSGEGVSDFATDSDYLIARYLVNDATTDTTNKNAALTNNNSVSWDNSQRDSLGAASFSKSNKSYLALSTSMLNGATENGFTVSLYAKPSNNNSSTVNNMGGRLFEFTTASYGGIDYNTNRDNFTYLSVSNTGIFQLNNKSYGNTISKDSGISYYNSWHLYTVSLSKDSITLYVDGTKQDSTSYNDTVSFESFVNNLANCNLLIGASGWPDDTYDGYISDFRVYNKAITDEEATKLPMQYQIDVQPDSSDVDKSLQSFSDKMSAGKAYTNMGNAYQAYIDLKEAEDAYDYGNKTVNLLTYKDNLDKAVANMTEWTAYKGTAVPSFEAGGNVDSAYYNNILYSPVSNGNNRPAASNKTANVSIDLYYAPTVMLYDGNSAPVMPVLFNSQNDSNKTRYIYQLYPCAGNNNNADNEKLRLTLNADGKSNANWQGRRDKSGTNFANAWSGNFAGYPQGKAGNSSTSERLQVNNSIVSSGRVWGIGANTMQYIGTPTDFTDTIPNVYWFGLSGDSASDKRYINANGVSIEVFNYRKVLDAIDTYSSQVANYTKNADQYVGGELTTLLADFDKLLADPNSFFSNNTVNGLSDCVSNYSKAITAVQNDLTNISEDKTYVENFSNLRTVMDTAKKRANVGTMQGYSDESFAEYLKVYDAAQSVMAALVDDGKSYKTLSADAKSVYDILNNDSAILNPLVETTSLTTAINNQNEVLSKGIFVDGAQKYTYPSWSALNDDVKSSENVLTTNNTKGKYATTSTSVTLDGNNYAYNVIDKNSASDAQNTINNEATTLSTKAMIDVDKADTYTNFDAAVTVVNAMDKEAFVDPTVVDTEIANAKAKVYVTLSDSEVSAYNAITGENLTTDSVLKITSLGQTDPATTALLEFTQNDNNIKKFTVTFGAQTENAAQDYSKTTENVKYGTLMTFDVNDYDAAKNLGEDKKVKWTVANDNNEYRVTTNADTIDVRIVSNVTVTAEVVNQKDTHTNYVVKFYNLYGNVANVGYTDDLPEAKTYDGTSISLAGVDYTADAPFYTLKGYTVSAPNNNIISVRPVYEATDTVEVNVIGGTATGEYLAANGTTATVDRPVTLSSSVDNFYAWAVKNGDKYQIATYNRDYTFKAYVDETYVPVVTTADGYAIYSNDGTTPLSASMIQEFSANASSFGLTDDDYLKAMLDSKAPFVAVQSAKEVSVNGETKYRMYIRITAGSEGTLSSFGVAKNGTKIAVKSRNTETGQLSVTLNGAASKYSSVQAYASYNFTYTFKDKDYNIVTTDYASIPTNA